MIDKKLLTILACPLCKGHLHYQKSSKELICFFDRLAFPIHDDIPVMLEQSARLVTLEELEKIKRKHKDSA